MQWVGNLEKQVTDFSFGLLQKIQGAYILETCTCYNVRIYFVRPWIREKFVPISRRRIQVTLNTYFFLSSSPTFLTFGH